MSKAIRLVATPAAKERATIVVVTEPAIFKDLPAPANGGNILVFDNSEDVYSALLHYDCTHLFADFRSLSDSCTGQRFLRQIKSSPETKNIEVWLLANEWQPHQETWAMKCGAAGFLHRNANAVAKRLGGNIAKAPPPAPKPLPKLNHIDAAFSNFAGPMAKFHIKAVRDQIDAGEVSPDPEAYTAELAQLLNLKTRRAEFIEAVKAAKIKK